MKAIGRNILIGLLTAAPLAITWLIVSFLFGQLSALGRPWITGVARGLEPQYPELAAFITNDVVQSVAAVTIVLAFLYLLGWSAGRVLGQRIIGLLEAVIARIPFVESVYRAAKRFLSVAGDSSQPGHRRVVLIEFPSPEMKTIGLVTKTLLDEATGEELAVVYVPTSPNPTSGYIEIVPTAKLVATDWTFDQAMSFVMTGGSNAPETLPFHTTERAAGDDTATLADPAERASRPAG